MKASSQKRFPMYVHGQYIHTPHHLSTPLPDGRPSLGAHSYLKLGCPESESLLDEALTGAFESFEQVQMGFFPLPERLDFLRRLREKLIASQDNISRLLSQEIGKPIALARLEVERALQTLEWTLIEAPLFFQGEGINTDAFRNTIDSVGWVRREGRGVLLAITPFNFPLNLAFHKLVPALSAGIPVILKPSEKAVATSLLIADLCQTSELPPGMLCVLPSDHELTERMIQDERIAQVSFTGSSSVGWRLKELAPRKPFTLELGGNAPVYVDRSADLKQAIPRMLQGAFAYAGQSCISIQNISVHVDIEKEFQTQLIEAMEQLCWGDVGQEKVLSGPVIDEKAFLRLRSLRNDWLNAGAKVLAAAGAPLQTSPDHENFLRPEIFTHIPSTSSMMNSELFGPFASLDVVREFSDWRSRVNAQSMRLQAAVFCADLKLSLEAARTLHFGGVIINESPSLRLDSMPYGGEGKSGYGREGPRYTLSELCPPKSVLLLPG